MTTARPLFFFIASLTLTGCSIILHPVDSRILPLPGETAPPGCSPEEITELPEGAQITITQHISAETSRVTRGTVLKASPNGVALINCRVEEHTVHGTPILGQLPYVGRLYKNSGVGLTQTPVLWVPQFQLNSIRVDEMPPADYVAPDVPIDMNYGNEIERIGIDFDFNIPDGKPGTLVPVAIPPGT